MKKINIISIITILFIFILLGVNKFLIRNDRNVNINLVGLNLHSDKDVYNTKKTIEKFFGFNCVIKKDIKTKYRGDFNPFLFKTELFSYNCHDLQNELGNNSFYLYNFFKDVNIYITTDELYNDDMSVNGITYGNEIYINTDNSNQGVVIHEILHNYGMKHCFSYNCLMSNNPSRKTWNNKLNKPIFCKSCRSNLPDFLKTKL